MREVGLEDSDVGIKIGCRTFNNLRYADDTTLAANSKEGLNKICNWRRKGIHGCHQGTASMDVTRGREQPDPTK